MLTKGSREHAKGVTRQQSGSCSCWVRPGRAEQCSRPRIVLISEIRSGVGRSFWLAGNRKISASAAVKDLVARFLHGNIGQMTRSIPNLNMAVSFSSWSAQHGTSGHSYSYPGRNVYLSSRVHVGAAQDGTSGHVSSSGRCTTSHTATAEQGSHQVHQIRTSSLSGRWDLESIGRDVKQSLVDASIHLACIFSMARLRNATYLLHRLTANNLILSLVLPDQTFPLSRNTSRRASRLYARDALRGCPLDGQDGQLQPVDRGRCRDQHLPLTVSQCSGDKARVARG